MSVRRLLGTLVAWVLAAASIVAATALAGSHARLAAGPGLRALEDVSFLTVCEFSHRGGDDPIVFPGKPGLSHDHTFFGNVSTDAFSTPQSLRAAATTCSLSADTAAYWAPTLVADNQAVEALDAQVYYRRRTVKQVRAFPPRLVMIAGDSSAQAPQSLSVTSWDCGKHGGAPPTSTVPVCPDARSKSLRLHVSFPDCWDGRRLDSADHRRHMAYSSGGVCPASHPVATPAIELIVQYPVAGGPGVELSSRGPFSGHADFVNAWQQAELERLVDYCLNALRVCVETS